MIAGVAILLDQMSKIWIRQNLLLGRTLNPNGWVRIVHVGNSGAGGGVLEGAPVLLAILSLSISLGVIFFYPRLQARGWMIRIAMGLLLGGGLGNLIDRVLQGYVTDFISIGSLPIFNIADVWVLIGAVLLALALA
jgi:signal peptidase II